MNILERVDLIIHQAITPAPRSDGGVYLDLRISLYADGHGAVSPIKPHDKHAVLNCEDDTGVIMVLHNMIAEIRRRTK